MFTAPTQAELQSWRAAEHVELVRRVAVDRAARLDVDDLPARGLARRPPVLASLLLSHHQLVLALREQAAAVLVVDNQLGGDNSALIVLLLSLLAISWLNFRSLKLILLSAHF